MGLLFHLAAQVPNKAVDAWGVKHEQLIRRNQDSGAPPCGQPLHVLSTCQHKNLLSYDDTTHRHPGHARPLVRELKVL